MGRGRTDLPERIPYGSEPRKLSLVLGQMRVARFLEAGSVWRVSEAVRLKVSDIEGMGARDRFAMLSPSF